MVAYTCHQWDSMLIANSDDLRKIASEQGNSVKDLIKSCNVIKRNFFLRNSRRRDDTY